VAIQDSVEILRKRITDFYDVSKEHRMAKILTDPNSAAKTR
jgi:hypothetical protein